MGEQIYEFVKEYDIYEKSIPKEIIEPFEIYEEQKQNVDVENVFLRDKEVVEHSLPIQIDDQPMDLNLMEDSN